MVIGCITDATLVRCPQPFDSHESASAKSLFVCMDRNYLHPLRMSLERESQALTILKRAVDLDSEKRYTEALAFYKDGLQSLINRMKEIKVDDPTKAYLHMKVIEYMERAEEIKKFIKKEKKHGRFHEEMHIANNSTGHSYKSLMGRFLDEDVTYITIEDPYIRSFHQVQNFVRFCELAVVSCMKLQYIDLTTTKDDEQKELGTESQQEWLTKLQADLMKRKIQLIFKFSKTLHDRKIILSTGWIIKIGRGLDIYKPPEHKFCMGMYDLDLRPCHETNVDIVHSKDVKETYG